MKRTLAALVAAILLPALASARPRAVGGEAAKAELMSVDTEFSQTAQEIGVGEAFARYADADAVMLPADANAVTGRAAVRRFAELPAGTSLVWKPNKADVAASGDLGYTLGTYEVRGKSADGRSYTRYGKYCSVWKRQKDGSWKWVVDIGTPSPPPQQH